ncbi:efflux RND transporter permease subunit [Pseudoalteromonas umbrosa]|uniref:efflux RND transporter permease subunit n=1 Tax=Pseudoalteromonas umbrosa TaxID=3048489 RepID=UPI0024C23784|nr:efflux RND transporter permease subunit [Pseudoalteromonas sp. B95]MDK1290634.1 efflux RND transporter permease subunit [Pseudoalteromonas sp. B95]
MSILSKNIENPGVSIVICFIAVFLGFVALTSLPVKLLPDTTSAALKIETHWRSASPYEIESNILEKQERLLRDIPGIQEMVSTAYQGRGVISLTVGNDVDRTEMLVNVLSKLNNVKKFPIDADPPKVKSFSAAESLIFMFLRRLEGNDTAIDDYQKLVELNVRSKLESIAGVAGVETFIGAQREYQIIVDPLKAAALGISLPAIASRLTNYHDITSGTMDVGRKQYLLRLQASNEPEQLKQLVLEWRDGNPVRLSDIGDVQITRGKRGSFAIFNGEPAIGLRLTRAPEANVLATLTQVFSTIDELNGGILADNQLKIEKSFDPSVFINRAILMVSSNIILGIIMAMALLLLFFKRWQPTLIIGVTVPISLIVSFIALQLFGRTLNVITLAGIAFASGLVMDNAIVVLESISTLKERGHSLVSACIEGVRKVWTALLASTVTTVVIFMPIALSGSAETELFSDLAIAVATAVITSLFVAIFIVPLLCKTVAKPQQENTQQQGASNNLNWLRKVTDSRKQQLSWVAVLLVSPVVVFLTMLPPLDYLPPLKKDSIDSFIRFPASAHLDLIEQEIVLPMAERLEPYLDGKAEPNVKNYYIAVSPGIMSMGTRAQDQTEINALKSLISSEITSGFPDTRAFTTQGSITGKFGGNRSFTFHLQSERIEQSAAGVSKVKAMLKEAMPGAVIRISPSLSAFKPELTISVNNERLSELGWQYTEFQNVVQMLGDGYYIGEHFDGQTRINKLLKTSDTDSPLKLAQTPLLGYGGTQHYFSDIARITESNSLLKVQRVDRRRAVSLTVIPPDDLTLGEAVTQVERLRANMLAALPEDAAILMGQTANKLNHSVSNLVLLMGLAIVMLFMIVAVILRSLQASFMVTLTLPLGAIGGVLLLNLLNVFTKQTLDLLTIIGFIILGGLVVNNAILLLCAYRDHIVAEGMQVKEAVYQAVAQRKRPILISTLTSIFGMLPLLLNPGIGSEIYRGLSAVVVGGMSFSLLFSFILIPCLLLLFKPYAGEKGTVATEAVQYA